MRRYTGVDAGVQIPVRMYRDRCIGKGCTGAKIQVFCKEGIDISREMQESRNDRGNELLQNTNLIRHSSVILSD